jgi:hypothetical protein
MRLWRWFPYLCVALAAAPAQASARWTFCVAAALGAKDVWITDVFVANGERERLESDLKNVLTRQGAQRISAQCPAPSEDKTAIVNAQTTAEDFNRKLGKALHPIPVQEILSRR